MRIETDKNGVVRAFVTVDTKAVIRENNLLFSKLDEINRLKLNDHYEIQIRELLNRINKALELLEMYNEMFYDYSPGYIQQAIEILKGGSNE